MNICHVNLASGYHGGENQTLQLLKQQVKMGYNLTVVANPKSPFADEVQKLDVKLVLASHFTKAHSKSTTQDCSLIMSMKEGRFIGLLFNICFMVFLISSLAVSITN
ncbi:Glycosyl transferases group 1 [Vibrio sp. B1FLJ16]|nr:Glycosyl transferases group 1 [Vibrio sp. B1FLJ16]CAE6880235.1 Glycosyl transferases group 1 [Vibrio sp. B1FLJ16]